MYSHFKRKVAIDIVQNILFSELLLLDLHLVFIYLFVKLPFHYSQSVSHMIRKDTGAFIQQYLQNKLSNLNNLLLYLLRFLVSFCSFTSKRFYCVITSSIFRLCNMIIQRSVEKLILTSAQLWFLTCLT